MNPPAAGRIVPREPRDVIAARPRPHASEGAADEAARSPGASAVAPERAPCEPPASGQEPAPAPCADAAPQPGPTIWGLTPDQVHDRYWASRGVQIVRAGDPAGSLAQTAELFLLLPPGLLVFFDLRRVIDLFNQLDPVLIRIRLLDENHPSYREQLFADADGRFLRFQRDYSSVNTSSAVRVAITSEREVAANWRLIPEPRGRWTTFTRLVHRDARIALKLHGLFADAADADEAARFVHRLVAAWPRPDAAIPRLRRERDLWLAPDADVPTPEHAIGPLWIGAGRRLGGAPAIGPGVIWDDPAHRPEPPPLKWFDIEPKRGALPAAPERAAAHATSRGKRVFDIAFALAVLALTLPLYPVIMLAIFIEDGRPIFFAHRRETLGGREFGCLKFRTMRRDADRIKAELAARNQADGPQFYIENDPRITRVGRLLRKLQLDELPQFLHVLSGRMSVVGPRPSPRAENQYNPAWREARLSVRPGVTGLWQVRRTRAAGTDFQEWIRYDIEYVERASWRMDLRIILDTVRLVLRPLLRR